jgi:hypothetical protein
MLVFFSHDLGEAAEFSLLDSMPYLTDEKCVSFVIGEVQ